MSNSSENRVKNSTEQTTVAPVSGNKFMGAVKAVTPSNKKEAAISGISFTLGSLTTLGFKALLSWISSKSKKNANNQ